MAEHLVAPDLLTMVQAEAAALTERRHGLDTPLGFGSELLAFAQNAFAQALDTELGIAIHSFSQSGKEEVLALAADKEAGEATAALLNLYVDVCNIWPDVLSEAYGGSSAEFLEFRTELVPDLLAELAELAKEREDQELAKAIEGASKDYAKALLRAA